MDTRRVMWCVGIDSLGGLVQMIGIAVGKNGGIRRRGEGLA